MDNEIFLQKMIADKMVLTVVDPTDYSEVECHVEGGKGNYFLVSNDEQGFKLPIRRLLIPGSSQFLILCDGVDDYFEVLEFN